MPLLSLAFDLRFENLYNLEGLKRLDALFVSQLRDQYPDLGLLLLAMRKKPENYTSKEKSSFLTEVVPFYEEFIEKLFKIYKSISVFITVFYYLI